MTILSSHLYNSRHIKEHIIGHSKIIDFLEKSRANSALAHAYIFYGPQWVGKTTVALWFTTGLLGLKDESELGINPDFIKVERLTDAKTGKTGQSIGIEQIRDVRERLFMSSFGGGKKVAVILDADRMTLESANALLKILEEPPAETILILVSNNIESIPATVRSRCQTIRFGNVPTNEIAGALLGMGASADLAQKIASASLGRPGRAISFLNDADALAEFYENASEFQNLLNGDEAERLRFVSDLIKKSASNKFDVVSDKLKAWEVAARDLLLASVSCEDLAAVNLSAGVDLGSASFESADADFAGAGAGRANASVARVRGCDPRPPSEQTDAIKRLFEARAALLQNANPQISLEYFLLNL